MTQANGADTGLQARRAVIEEFVERLRRLRLEAGKPAFRTMAKVSGKVSHTTLHDALSGSRLPTWPTVVSFVQACGGDPAEWRQHWLDAAEVARPEPDYEGERVDLPLDAVADSVPIPAPAPVPDAVVADGGSATATEPVGAVGTWPGPRGRGRSRRRTFLAGVAAGVVLGAAVGVGVTLAVGGGSVPVACPTSDAQAAGPSTVDATDGGNGTAGTTGVRAAYASAVESAATARTGASPTWVDRPASDAQILTTTAVALPVTSQVTSGDALVVTLMLTSTCPGPVTVTDTLGDTYSVAADDTDTARHRTMVFVAFGVKPLTTADAIHVAYPHASKYHVAVDEFRGVSEVVGRAHAHGEVGTTAFSTSQDPVDCQAGELMVAAVGTNTGLAPTMVRGWTTLPILKLSSYVLTTAYQVAPVTGRCAATGTTTAQWGADLVVLR